MSMPKTTRDLVLRDYDRGLLKSGLTSLFWAVIMDRKRRGKYTMLDVARATGKHKSAVSRWFSSPPNWRLETVADIASALDLDLEIRARDRATGQIFTASGPEHVGPRFGAIPATASTSPTKFVDPKYIGASR